jgi:hypothetical protein
MLYFFIMLERLSLQTSPVEHIHFFCKRIDIKQTDDFFTYPLNAGLLFKEGAESMYRISVILSAQLQNDIRRTTPRPLAMSIQLGSAVVFSIGLGIF